jgi:hypothetical protein
VTPQWLVPHWAQIIIVAFVVIVFALAISNLNE